MLKFINTLVGVLQNAYLCTRIQNTLRLKGEMAEWSIAAVLKTVEGHTSGGSNPSLSAKIRNMISTIVFRICI